MVAAAIHCGLLPRNRIPAAEEFLAVPFYDRTPPALIGTPYYMGCDEFGHKVYFMGLLNQRQSINAAFHELLDIAGLNSGGYLFVDAFPLINLSTKLGGLLSKKCRMSGVGRKLTIWGVRRRYTSFIALVEDIKAGLGKTPD